jgi:hypothetical protein
MSRRTISFLAGFYIFQQRGRSISSQWFGKSLGKTTTDLIGSFKTLPITTASSNLMRRDYRIGAN